jgi:hypothetical protein
MNRAAHSSTAAVSALILAMALAASSAYGQDYPKTPTAKPEVQTHQMSSMSNTPSMHEMPATVTNVDHNSGVVDVESEKMNLKVHFPSNTIADLKKGDKITLHLGYSKP